MTQELSDSQVAKILEILAERTRASERLAATFQPPHVGIVEEATARQHQLIVGRRGVGKSMLLLNVVARARGNDQLAIYLDLENLRGIPYPDVLIRLFAQLAEELSRQLRTERGWARTLLPRRKLAHLHKELTELLEAPQQMTTSVRTEAEDERGRMAGAQLDVEGGKGPARLAIQGSRSKKRRDASQVISAAEFTKTKMEGLQSAAPEFRELLKKAVADLKGRRVLVVLDDFYFIPRADQADVLAYLHQVAKGLEIWMKIGGVEHRLEPFVEGDPPRGLQPFHDAGFIRLDATLRDFNHTRAFLEGILSQAVVEVDAQIHDLLTETGAERLVLASGGVPRDYLNLTAAALRRASKRDGAPNRPRNRINAEDVSEVAPDFLDQKEQELTLDASNEDIDRLRRGFNDVVKFCVHEQRRNVFLVEATELREQQWGRDLAALAELRFLHRVANLTVKSSSQRFTGRRYEAFVLDLSAYAGSRVRQIEMIPFWESGGLQRIRGATFVYTPTEVGKRRENDLEQAEREGAQLSFEELD